MDHHIFRWPVLNFVFRTSKAIPIASAKEDPAMMERPSTKSARRSTPATWSASFPKGKITADGNINPFRPGITRILARNPVPVVPMALRGLWGSFFSRKDGPAMTRPFRRGVFSRIELVVGAAVPANRGFAGAAAGGRVK
jgi:1-acyl-sn-glycerol-3-phosphate acyltransferase